MAAEIKVLKTEGLPVASFKPNPKDEAAVSAYRAREKEQPKAARIKITKQDGADSIITMAPALGEFAEDEKAVEVAAIRLTTTFGGISYTAAACLLDNIVHGTKTKSGVNERLVNQSLALVASVAPRDGTEAMLVVQMVNTHGLIAELQKRMMNKIETLPQQDSNGGLLVRLLRTYATQVETLKRYRTGGEQRVSVTHQHVTVNADKAAVAVNPLSANELRGGVIENSKEQPHEPRPTEFIDVSDDLLSSPLKANRQTVRK